jgi:hypothetical protein
MMISSGYFVGKSTPALDAAVPAAVDVSKLPAELQAVAQEHEATLQKELQRLQSNYCVNQWKVKR